MTTPAPAPPAALPAGPPADSPLTAAYDTAGALVPGLRIAERAPRHGDGWLRADELASGGAALEGFLAREQERAHRDYGAPARPDVAAGFALHRYAWPAASLFTVPWFLLRRVPRITVADLSVHPERGRVTVRPGLAFHCLPGDPAGALPKALPVSGEEALRDAVRDAAAGLLEPLLEAFRPYLRRGRRALWGLATDELAGSLWYFGQLLGREREAVAAAGRLLPGVTAPYTGRAGFRELTGSDGVSHGVTRDRVTCCLFYTLRPAETCSTCPRTCDSQRIDQLNRIR
ncbi:(2Fe-2S)-binding protein [Streptomyces aidingensis]|uniref:FhuF 2Fe-2S C-terminal domain-containing protein n=1 Tax=Streptomyces aidingensis TaxID=910347 RepID=A0A1I1J013_9ACTN|nr:(2Fe-2S)-binding protein [Streptomyces aidingensis]SFC38810.1 FhuF 2Fe-2S C-terminal domain-containing protein [Streptomyces aidingensis]